MIAGAAGGKDAEVFGCDACLYGEGYGAKIQKGGGNYRADQDFVTSCTGPQPPLSRAMTSAQPINMNRVTLSMLRGQVCLASQMIDTFPSTGHWPTGRSP